MNSPSPLSPPLVVIVDDEPEILFSSTVVLRRAGLTRIETLDDSRRLLPLLAVAGTGVVVLDLQMPHLSGRELLVELAANFPHIPVIIVTAANELDTAVACMKMGAFDYMVKPIEPSRFVASVRKALEMNTLRQEISCLRESLLSGQVRDESAFAEIRTRNSGMKSIFGYLEAIAPSGQPVLVTGETGVGKELIARALHDLSGRTGRFVAVNSAGLDDLMFSDTLFGHRKGAFTGADRPREGMIGKASGGTLFLDEIGDMNLASQVKLLRLLQDGEFFPLGSDAAVLSTARVVVATNRDLERLMTRGEFRRDLYYRLRAHHVHIPPLRERFEDLPLLLEHFLHEASLSLHKKRPTYPPELITHLSTYRFPGNVRELKSMVYDAVARHQGGVMALGAFTEVIGNGEAPERSNDDASPESSGWLNPAGPFPTMKEVEDGLIAEALRRSGGNQGAAARLLGISRQALNKRLARKDAPDRAP
jgi:DNA-binding NtrC family response regulator